MSKGGDPLDVVQMIIILVDMVIMILVDMRCFTMVTNGHSLIPFENILSSRDYIPYF